MAIYCPQGRGTLRQQLLMMHGIAWYCMVLHGIAWYCIVPLIVARWYPPLSHLTALQACQGVIGGFLETRSCPDLSVLNLLRVFFHGVRVAEPQPCGCSQDPEG